MRCDFQVRMNVSLFAVSSWRLTPLACIATVCLLSATMSYANASQTPAHAAKTVALQLQPRGGTAGDSDGDSVPDIADLDDDNDTIPDDVEGNQDTDGDGIIDCLDLDSDNDGLSDLFEAINNPGILSLIDSNGDGQTDPTVAVGSNGLADLIEQDFPDSGVSPYGLSDLDGDGVVDQRDLDVDNDGIPDVIEAGSIDDNRDARYDLFLDLDADGFADRLSISPIIARDTDQDGVADFRDIDSDQDGITDLLETTGVDTDSDGRVDDFTDLNVDGLHDTYINAFAGIPDTDQDGFPDYRDTDSDGDGVTDSEEAFNSTVVPQPIIPSTPFNPRPNQSAQDANITLETGESGSVFGCAISDSRQRGTDPMFILLVMLSLFGLLKHAVVKAGGITRFSVLAMALLLSACVSQPRNPNIIAGGETQFTPYAGIGLGGSFLNANTDNVPLIQDESFSTAGQITLGTTINHRLAIELRAADLGEATFTNGRAVGYQVADVSGLFKQRFDKLTGFGRLGMGALFNDGDIRTTQKNQMHLLVGLGADYSLTPRLAFRAEWQGHDADVMHAQLSLLYSFGTPPVRKPAVFAKREGDTVVAEDREVAAAVPDNTSEPETKYIPMPESAPLPQRPSATGSIDKPAPDVTVAAVEPAAVEPQERQLPQIAARPDTELAMAETAPRAQPLPEITSSPKPSESQRPESERLRPLVTVPTPAPEPATEPEPAPAPIQKKSPATPADSDGDGIVDASDKCPGTDAGTIVLADGCSLFGESVPGLSFVPNTDELTASGIEVLDTVADALSDESDIRVTVAAHTAAGEDADAAMFLTRRRTIAIIRYLSDKGIDATRLRPEAFGDTQPLAGATDSGENDRVVMTLR